MKKEEKTNVMRVLDSKKISYEGYTYEPDATLTGTEYGGNSADAGDVHADVKEAGSSDIWGAEW